MMKFKLSKIDAAADQLDWAIRLFLDHKAYVAAITLAGAAEELIGKPLQDRAAFKQLATTLSARFGLDRKAVTQDHLNKARNWLKHWDENTDHNEIELELDEEAIQYIVRSLANFAIYDSSTPSQAPDFSSGFKEIGPNYWLTKLQRAGFFGVSRSVERRVQDVHERWRDALTTQKTSATPSLFSDSRRPCPGSLR